LSRDYYAHGESAYSEGKKKAGEEDERACITALPSEERCMYKSNDIYSKKAKLCTQESSPGKTDQWY